MAAKKPKTFQMSNEHRTKIQNSQILKYLIEHATGQREMTTSQVNTGLGLLKKILPDLSSVTLEGNEERPIVFKLTVGGEPIAK